MNVARNGNPQPKDMLRHNALRPTSCYIHDCWWAKCERTFAEFKQSNGVFKDNLMELNRVFSGSWLERAARWPIIYAWWLLVSGKQGLRHFIA